MVILALLAGCGSEDAPPMDGGSTSTGDDAAESSSSTGEDTSGSSETGPVDPTNADDSTTGMIEYPPPMEWGDCKNIPRQAACLPGDVCVMLGQNAVCLRPDCADSFDCPDMPRTGTAPVVCSPLGNAHPDNVCNLLCSGGQQCPDAMTCSMGVCAWAGP